MTDTAILQARYDAFCALGLHLDMSRGKPEPRQLDLSLPMLRMTDAGFACEDGVDARNYGDPTGIPEAKRLFGALLGMPPEQVIVGGNSSVDLIYDALVRAILHGPLPGDTPWKDVPGLKFLCPVPGYDWHFHMLAMLGVECVPVPLVDGSPDMDMVERLVRDPSVKGIICVPMYGNPSGLTFSDEAVRRLARMETAAQDFRIFWDNAYCVHHLYPGRRDQPPRPLRGLPRSRHGGQAAAVHLHLEDHLRRRRRQRHGRQPAQHRAAGGAAALPDGLL